MLPYSHRSCSPSPPLLPPAAEHYPGLGVMPHPTQLPTIPTFNPTGGTTSGLDVLASAALQQSTVEGLHPTVPAEGGTSRQSLHNRGPYNPAATLPPKVVKKILALEYVEMVELRADIWPDDTNSIEGRPNPRCPAKPPITNILSWLDCYARMAAVLALQFPEKSAELWAYQTTILHAAHTYEEANWVTYDRLYRREMLLYLC